MQRALERELIEELKPRLNVRRRPRIPRTPTERALLREAKALYEERVKSALLAGLLATNPTAAIDPATGYVTNVRDNLLSGISLVEIEAEFTDAAGHELESKMRAPWSSSALAVNSFAPWRRDAALLTLAGRVGFDARFKFEEACPNEVSPIAPHLDVVLRRPGEVVAVESKCTEFIQGGDHGPVAAGYKRLADHGDERAPSRWFAALDHVERFLLLDGYQLVKHYLGLRNLDEKQLTLVYLYWEPAKALEGPGADLFALHRREVAEFARLVEGDETCEFHAFCYLDYWAELDAIPEQPSW
ncbi:MAG: PGN_0703 family putative restriction endonuclease, partial [Gaiellaceae bacterium]